MVAHIADNIAVMYRGGVMEEGPVASVLQPPYHPYTEALLSAVPIVGKRRSEAKRIRLVGDPGSGMSEVGCRFASRCPRKLGAICDTVTPPWRDADASHRIACHIPLGDLSSVPLLQREIRVAAPQARMQARRTGPSQVDTSCPVWCHDFGGCRRNTRHQHSEEAAG